MDNMVLLITEIAGLITAVSVVLAAVRKFTKLVKQIADGQRCILRNEMLHTYYKHREKKEIRQYEFENFISSYEAYKALGGNSFIDKIHDEIHEWEVST